MIKKENIKFKAKRLDNGEWVKGDLAHSLDGGLNIFGFTRENGVDGYSGVHLIDPSTVCQFTGLKDCEGNEVWEHDLIHFVGYKPTAEVIWSEDDYAFMTTSNMNLFLLSDVIGVGNGKIKVIGNKFNKEK